MQNIKKWMEETLLSVEMLEVFEGGIMRISQQ